MNLLLVPCLWEQVQPGLQGWTGCRVPDGRICHVQDRTFGLGIEKGDSTGPFPVCGL